MASPSRVSSRGIGQEFMRLTRYEFQEPSEQSLGLPQPPLELPVPADAPRIELPEPHRLRLEPVDLLALINKRRSLRHPSADPLTLQELSFLLWCTQGVKEVTSRPATLRPVPSAGARHAFETFVMAFRVQELPVGLYRFIAGEHRLTPVDLSPDVGERVILALSNQDGVRASAATFIWVAVRARMYWRYGERGYRYLHLDAGHVCQNLYLAAEAIGAGACAIGAFLDEDTCRVLGVDGVELFPIYAATVGKRKQTA
jgi:SagB-type dehydrogenase family enzyme